MSRVREARAKVLLSIYLKLVKGTRGTNVGCSLKFLEGDGSGEGNAVSGKRTGKPFASEVCSKGCVAGVSKKVQGRIG